MNQVIRIENLSLGYGNREIFSGIDADLQAGALAALIGANGAGKSTLLRTIAALEPVRSGRVLLSGESYDSLRRRRIAEQIAFVPSMPSRAANMSVSEMLATNCYFRSGVLGNVGRRDRDLIVDALGAVSLDGFGDRDICSLSDGEFQRAAIAGAVVKDGQAILLDEPTAFLDAANKVVVTGLLRDIAHSRGKAVLFSTHDIALALESADILWLMCADGSFYQKTPQEAISRGVLNKIFKISDIRFDPIRRAFYKVRG